MSKLERTGGNVVKMEQAKRGYQMARDDYEKANRLLLMELPQFYEKRVDYFQPSLQVALCPEAYVFDSDNSELDGVGPVDNRPSPTSSAT